MKISIGAVFWISLILMVMSLSLRVWSVQTVRSSVGEFYTLKEREKLLDREKTQLSLELSVLIRASRLRVYAENRLGLVRASKVKYIK